MTEPEKPAGLKRFLPYLPFAIAALPVLVGLYFAQLSVTPESVCDVKIHMMKQDIRWCLITGGHPRECLK